jgi:hypothetical protein
MFFAKTYLFSEEAAIRERAWARKKTMRREPTAI